MNKNIKLAVAGAVLALSATAANAGIIIPAGEWTIDINGNVNAFLNQTNLGNNRETTGSQLDQALVGGKGTTKSIQTGLLPAWLGFTGKTRQNDLDVEFTISLQPGVSGNDITGDGATVSGASAGAPNQNFLNRQTYLSFGDKSWGSIKLGKDLGIFASDAILNDMTLLGVGSGGGLNSAINSTNGGIGTGYTYAAWKAQAAYTTPNMGGFQATIALTNPNQIGVGGANATAQSRYGVEAKASYAFTADAIAGKVWVSGASYDASSSAMAAGLAGVNSINIWGADIGANVNLGNVGLTGYVYGGEGLGATFFGTDGMTNAGLKRDSHGGYAQATYVLPSKTKVGVAYGISSIDRAAGEAAANGLVKDQERYTVGAYHPLTKHLNLVAEYSNIKLESQLTNKNEFSNVSLGAIMFF
ncbi:OmpC Outer membrane protein (porin) [Methylophilaceae bacterium]